LITSVFGNGGLYWTRTSEALDAYAEYPSS